jgi:hypothetical protein
MNDIEILARYLQRRFRGRVEIFDGIDKWSNLRIYVRNSISVEFWVKDGEIEIHRASWHVKTKLHMADPDFEVKLYVFLVDKAGVKPSRLKAEY